MIAHLALLLAVLTSSTAPPSPASCSAKQPHSQERYGHVQWFEGSYEELLAEAAEENRLILLNFYSDRCVYSRYLAAEAYSDSKIVKTLAPVLCFSVNADSEMGKPLNRQFPTKDLYPALIFLDSDGQLRDRIIGYKSPKKILPMIERIIEGTGTLGRLRLAVTAVPNDLEAHWQLATKLKQLDDLPGYQRHLAIIKKLDPKGESLPMHRLALDEASAQSFRAKNTVALRAFLKRESHSELLYEGWCLVAHDELRLAGEADCGGSTAEAAQHRREYHKAHLMAWPHHPKDKTAQSGNHIAWAMYRDWSLLDEAQQSLAVEIARTAVAASPDSCNFIDTLACLLHKQGRAQEATELMRKCIKLQPHYALWQERLKLFSGE